MREVRLKVPDMSCGHCTAAVHQALEGLPGTIEVDVSLETKVVKIICDSEIEMSALMGAIKGAGYTPESLP